jgi:two-component system NtrC family sensor kinase
VIVLSLGGRGRREYEPKTIEQIVEAALAVYGPTLAQNGIEVARDYAPGLPEVRVCPFELQRLLLNLLSNACDAMPGGGQVRIRAVETRIPLPNAPACIRLVIEDTGPGFSDSALKGLFKPFTTTKGEGKGTGLGLYLCRLIAMDHGGSLHADNAPGGGAHFELLLPGTCGSAVAV